MPTPAHEVDESTPVDPFEMVSNETRLEIVRTLYEHLRSNGWESELSYSTLRERVGIRDKGNFNYHLGELRGTFVERGADGYRVTFAGFEIAKAIEVGAWATHEQRGPVEVGTAPLADGDDPLTAVYDDSRVQVSDDEGRLLFQHALRPSGVADREMEAIVDTMATVWLADVELMIGGVCAYCHGPTDRSVEHTRKRPWTHSLVVACPECGPVAHVPVGLAIVDHPAVVSFHWDHGIDLRDRRFWELEFLDDDAVAVLETDPVRLRIDVSLEGDRLAVTIDENARVVAIERNVA